MLIWVCRWNEALGGSYIGAPRKGVRLFPPTSPQEFVNINLIRNITRNLKQRAIFRLAPNKKKATSKSIRRIVPMQPPKGCGRHCSQLYSAQGPCHRTPKQRPIDAGGVHRASKTDHFQGYFQRLSRIKAIESSRLMERAMGIEPTSVAWEFCFFDSRNVEFARCKQPVIELCR